MEYPFFRYFLNFLCILLARLVAGLRLFFFGDLLGVNNFPRVFSIYISVFFNRIGRLKKALPAGVEPATLRSSAVIINNSLTLTIRKYYRLSYRSLMNLLTTCSGRSDLPVSIRLPKRNWNTTALYASVAPKSEVNSLTTCSGQGSSVNRTRIYRVRVCRTNRYTMEP